MSDTVETQSTEPAEPVTTDETTQVESQEQGNDEFKSEESKKAVLADLKTERERRKALQAEVDQFKTAAAEAEKAQMSDVERAQAEAKEALQRAEKAETERLRYQIAATHSITDQDDIELFLTGSDEETLTRQAQRLAERNSAPNNPKPDLTQGASGKHTPPSNAEMFAQQLGDF